MAASIFLLPSVFLKIDATQFVNGNAGVETTLNSFVLPAGSMGTNVKALRIHAWGITAANANAKSVRLYFGSATIATPISAVAANNKNWQIEGIVLFRAANSQVARSLYTVEGTIDGSNFMNAVTETDTSDILIKVTGTSDTAASDVTQNGFMIEKIF